MKSNGSPTNARTSKKLIKAEQSKVNALRNATARWLRAAQIRSFVLAARNAAVQNGESVETGSPFGDWVIWAERQADRLDPLKENPPSIIDQKSERKILATTVMVTKSLIRRFASLSRSGG